MDPSYHNHTDEDLYRQMAIKKDEMAFNTLFSRYKPLVYGVCVNYLTDKEKAKDALQNIFLKVWKEAGRHQVRYFKSWLYQVTKNFCLMELRGKHAKIQLNLNSEVEDVEWLDYLHLKLKEEELLEHLERCLKTLRKEQYDCVQYFYFEEKSYHEVAIKTGYSKKEVKSYIQNGRRNLKTCMKLVTKK